MPDTHRLRLFAAGSLRATLTALVAAYGAAPELVFGPAGLLRERIEGGDVPDVFLSANLAHPQTLAAARPGTTVQPLARNALVALARPELGLTTGNFLDRLMQDGIRIGTSTPILDPSGDYAHMLFDRAEAVRPGARAHLLAHAQALVGGRDSAPSPPGEYPARRFLVDGTVDLFLTYASNASTMGAEFDLVWPPSNLAVEATYGLIVLKPSALAANFAAWIGSPAAKLLLTQHGFMIA